jgi:hypothetical protein
MSIEINRVVEFTRQNSGRHFLDSGDHYGRVYDTPAPESKFRVDGDDGQVYLTVTGLLAEHATVREEVQTLLDAAWGSGKRGESTSFTTPDGVEHDATDLDNFAVGPAVMEALGYECKARDNTYNGETDLDQEFVWEVWTPVDSDSDDWIWDEDAVILIYAHTGCDVRGGYATPIAVQFEDCDYSIPTHFVVDFRAADDATEEWLDRHHNEDEFSQGYTSNPQYHLQESVGEFVSHNPEAQTLTFKNPHEGEGEPETVTFGYDFWV